MSKGRPAKEISREQLEKLAALPLRATDIASVLGVSVDTLSRRISEWFGVTCAEYLDQKRASLRFSLMAKQYSVAMGGNVTMLIWLGKQYLDQRDKNSTELSGPDGRPIETKGSPSELSDAELDERIRVLQARLASPKGETSA